jgi:ribosome-binding factor A
MKAHRTARVAEVIREVAAETILFELKDPRVK